MERGDGVDLLLPVSPEGLASGEGGGAQSECQLVCLWWG